MTRLVVALCGLALLVASTASARVSPDFIRGIVRTRLPQIRACYEAGLRDQPALAGRVTTRFTVAPDGHVASTQVVSSTLGAPAVEQCILDALATLSFPPTASQEPMSIHYPFTFAP